VLFPSGMGKFWRSMGVSSRQITKVIATVSLGSMVESCSGAGKVAIGKAEQLWFSNMSAGGRGPMMMCDDCSCKSSPVVAFSVRRVCWQSVWEIRYRATWEAVGDIPVVGSPNPLTSKWRMCECNEGYRIQM
jgi:hypothetical protein